MAGHGDFVGRRIRLFLIHFPRTKAARAWNSLVALIALTWAGALAIGAWEMVLLPVAILAMAAVVRLSADSVARWIERGEGPLNS